MAKPSDAPTSELMLRILRTLGNPREAEYYLSLFRNRRAESFALIVVSASVMRSSPESVLVELRFLAQLGLTPVVVLGLVEPEMALTQAKWLAAHLKKNAVLTKSADVASAASRGQIPLVAIAPGEESAVEARFNALGTLATELNARKIIFLERHRGFSPSDKAVPSMINIPSEYAVLLPLLPDKQAKLLTQAKCLLEAVPHFMTISVTTPLNLLKELFTIQGAGTLIRKSSKVVVCTGYEDIDLARLRTLIERAFGAPLRPEFRSQAPKLTFVADDYRGAALTRDTPLGPYLSKFAVDGLARGEGVGRDLWVAIEEKTPTLFWRSRPGNPITSWYAKHCDGLVRTDDWHIFWRGLPHAKIPEAIRYARELPRDLGPAADPHKSLAPSKHS